LAIQKISHIGIAVRSLDEQKALYRDVLGLKLLAEEEVADQQVKVAIFEVGDSRVELLEPTSSESPIAKFLEKRGEGIHHVAYEVDSVGESLAHYKAQGVRLIDQTPRAGAEGAEIAFLHPKATFGALTEICHSKGDQ